MILALLAYCAVAYIWGAWILSQYPWVEETPAWCIGLAWLWMPVLFAMAAFIAVAECVGRLLRLR